MTEQISFSVNNKKILIPYRIYDEINSQSDMQHACMMTRHSNGYVREKYLRKILHDYKSTYEIIPYIALLTSEYVIEILQIIEENDWIYNYLDLFFRENKSYYFIFKSRIISYWNEYYRDKFPEFKHYPGSNIISRLEAMNPSITN